MAATQYDRGRYLKGLMMNSEVEKKSNMHDSLLADPRVT